MGLVVKKPGVITTIQDVGRFGYQGSGFSTCLLYTSPSPRDCS